jgi:hypothetical protein
LSNEAGKITAVKTHTTKEPEIVFIKNKCLSQLLKWTVLQKNPPIINVVSKLEEKA